MSQPPSESDYSRWFATEVKPHERPLRSYLRRVVASLTDVEDLLQETYLRLVRAKRSGAVRQTKPFMFAIARNAAIDLITRRTREDAQQLRDDSPVMLLEPPEDVAESVCKRQEMDLLWEAIEELPARCREVFLLRRIKGLSQKEIAEVLGISENTVESLASRGVHRVGEYLRARGLGPSSHDG